MTEVSRRTLAKTAAWSIPVVAIGASAPASAASTPVDNTYITVESVCREDSHNGGDGKPVIFRLLSPVYVISVSVAGHVNGINCYTSNFCSLPIPNKDLNGSNIVIVITYSIDNKIYTEQVHSTLSDCHAVK